MDTQTTEHNAIVVVNAKPVQAAPVVEDRSSLGWAARVAVAFIEAEPAHQKGYSNDVAG